MGVRDLTAVAKRYAPECITTHASIRDFRGKTLAIDANLLTTKFHYANAHALGPKDGVDPRTLETDEYHGHRHARAWYYFLRRLKDHDIKPIVVFDGSTRLDAKARENERRRVAREVQRLRGEAESIRGDRLRTIRAVLVDVDEQDRNDFVTAFQAAARSILDERERGSGEPGGKLPARVREAQETERATRHEQGRHRVRELIEAFELLVKSERSDSIPQTPPPSMTSSETPPDARAPTLVAESSAAPPPAAKTIPLPAAETALSPVRDNHDDQPSADETAALPGQDMAPEETLTSEAFGSERPPEQPATSQDVVPERATSDRVPSEETAATPPSPTPCSPGGVSVKPTAPKASLPPERETLNAAPTTVALREAPDTPAREAEGHPDPASGSAPQSILAQALLQQPATMGGPPSPPSVSRVDTLAYLFEAHLADATNPIYSRNQVDVFRKEALFFSSLVLAAPAALSVAQLSLAQDVLSATEALAALDEQPTSKESGPAEGREPEQGQAEVVAAEAEKPSEKPTIASYESNLHPIIARSSELQQSHNQRAKGISAVAFREVRTLIEALGVPWLQPTPDHPHEAEGVCAALQQYGLADLVISEDTDVVVYGAPVLRNISLADQPKVPMNVLDPVKLRGALGLSRAEFVDFAILLGTDFTERIKGLGPVSALKAVRKYRTVENVLNGEAGRFRLSQAFIDAYLATAQTAREIFLKLPPLPAIEMPSAVPADAVTSDGIDSGRKNIAEPAQYLGTLRTTEASPILPLLLAKYGVPRLSDPDYDDFSEDVFADDEISLAWTHDDGVWSEWDSADDLDGEVNSGAGTVEDTEPDKFAEAELASSASSSGDPITTGPSLPTCTVPSLDSAFERLYL